jgi:hypothetical protein
MKMKSLLVSATVALATLSLLAPGCSKSERLATAWQPPRPVRIDSPGVWGNLFQSWPNCTTSADKVDGVGLLARDGDWIFAENEKKSTIYSYRANDGPVVKPTLDKGLLRVAGRVVGVAIEDDSAGRDWLERATPAELAAVRVLSLSSDLDDTILPTFRKLAAVNPHIAVFTSSHGNLRLALRVLRPMAYLFPGGDECDWKEEVVAQKQVDTLWIERDGSIILHDLQSLPCLRRLTVFDWRADSTGRLPPGLVNLRSLEIWGGDETDIAALGSLPTGLEELSIRDNEQLSNVSALAALTDLKALSLTGCDKVTDLSALAGLRQLQCVALPSGISQMQFAGFVAAHRNLTVLEITGCKQVTDLTPLRDLPGLESMILSGRNNDALPVIASPRNLEVLRSLKSLRYLAVYPGSGKEVSPEFVALQRALPDALVVPVAPMCLGSGWILLLLPVVAVAAWRGARRARD